MSVRLREKAASDPTVLEAVQAAELLIQGAVQGLEAAMAGVQDDPSDVGERIVRSFLVRGTVGHLVEKAFTDLVNKSQL